MVSFDPVALLTRYAQVKDQHDVESMLALTHSDCRYEDVGVDVVVTGTAELRRYHEHLFTALPDYRAAIDGIAGAGDTAVAWGKFTGTLTGPLFGLGEPGRRLEVPAVFVCEFRDGLLYRERAHIDLVTLRRAAGSPGAAFLTTFTNAWDQPTGERLAELFTEDATVLHPGMSEPVRGRDAIRVYFDSVLARSPDLRLRPLMTSVSGNTVFIHWRMRTSDLSWEGVDRFDLRADRAVAGLAHFDPAQLSAPSSSR